MVLMVVLPSVFPRVWGVTATVWPQLSDRSGRAPRPSSEREQFSLARRGRVPTRAYTFAPHPTKCGWYADVWYRR